MQLGQALILGLLVASVSAGLQRVRPAPLDVYKGSAAAGLYQGQNKLQAKCELHWRNTTLDHFDWVLALFTVAAVNLQPAHGLASSLQDPAYGNKTTFPQRFFLCKDAYKAGGPIFFYAGKGPVCSLGWA